MMEKHHQTGMSSLAAAAAASRQNTSSREASVPTCSFFARGECRRGSACRFRHELPQDYAASRKKKPTQSNAKRDAAICSFYARGDCRRGEACAFRHETPPERSPRKEQQPKTETKKRSARRDSHVEQHGPEKRWFYGETGWYYGTCHPQPGEWQEHGVATSTINNAAQKKPMSSLAAAAAAGKTDSAATKQDDNTARKAPPASSRRSLGGAASPSPLSGRKTHGGAATSLSPKTVKSPVSPRTGKDSDDAIKSPGSGSSQKGIGGSVSPRVSKIPLPRKSLSPRTTKSPPSKKAENEADQVVKSPSPSTRKTDTSDSALIPSSKVPLFPELDHKSKAISEKEISSEFAPRSKAPLQPLTARTENRTEDQSHYISSTQSKSTAPTDIPSKRNEEKRSNDDVPLPNKKETGAQKNTEDPETQGGVPLEPTTNDPVKKSSGTSVSKKKSGILPSFTNLKIVTSDLADKDIALSRTSTTTEDVSPLAAMESPSHGFDLIDDKGTVDPENKMKVSATPPLHGARSKHSLSNINSSTAVSTPPPSGLSSLARAAAAGKRNQTDKPTKSRYPNSNKSQQNNRKIPYWERLYQDGEKIKQKHTIMQTEVVDRECTFSPNLTLSTPRSIDGGRHAYESRNRNYSRTPRSVGKNSHKDRNTRGGSGVPRVIGGPTEQGKRRGKGGNRECDESSVLSENSLLENDGRRRNFGSTRKKPGSPSSSTANSKGGGRRSFRRSRNSKSAGNQKSGSPSSLSARAAAGRYSSHNKQSKESQSASKTSGSASSVTSPAKARRSFPKNKSNNSDASSWAPGGSSSTNGKFTFERRNFASGTPKNSASRSNAWGRDPPSTRSKRVDESSPANIHVSGREPVSSDLYGKRSVKSLAARFEGASGRSTPVSPAWAGRGTIGNKEAAGASHRAQGQVSETLPLNRGESKKQSGRPNRSSPNDERRGTHGDTGSKKPTGKRISPRRHRWGSDSDDDY